MVPTGPIEIFTRWTSYQQILSFQRRRDRLLLDVSQLGELQQVFHVPDGERVDLERVDEVGGEHIRVAAAAALIGRS